MMRVILRGGQNDGQQVVGVEGKAKYLQVPVPYYPPDGWETRERQNPKWANVTILEMRDPATGEWQVYSRFTAETFEASGETEDGVPVWRLCKPESIKLPPSGKPLVVMWD